MQRAGGRDTEPARGSRGPQARSAAFAAGLLAALALALLAAAGGAQGHHTNATCVAGGYTQVWNAPVTVVSPQPAIVGECILVQADVSVEGSGELRFRDSKVVFDNELGNFSFFVNSSALLEFRDDDGSTATNDRSWLGLVNISISWTGYFFGNAPGATVHFNDTDIEGGGLPGAGLSSATAFFVDTPAGFSWSRVTHYTVSSGLVITNYTKGLTIPAYGVSGDPLVPFAYGLVLYRCENVLITGFSNPLSPGATGVFVEEGQNITVRNSTATTAGTGFRFYLSSGILVEDTQSLGHGDTGFQLELVDGAVLNRVGAAHPVGGRYGLSLISSTRVDVFAPTLRRHDTADLLITGTSRWVNVTDPLLSLNRAGSGLRVVGTGAADAAADLVFRNLVVSSKGPAGGYAVVIERANRVLVQGFNISGAAGSGVFVGNSTDVRFAGGSITSNTQGVGFTSSGNVSYLDSTLSNNAGGGLTVGGGSFLLENVTMRGNGGWSIRSAAVTQLTGDSAIRNSTLEGVTGSVVEITLTGGSATLAVANTQFVRLTNAPQLFWALDLDGFSRVSVEGSSMASYGVRVARGGEATLNGTSMDVVILPANTTLLRFDQVATVRVEGVRFGADPLAGKLGTVANVTGLAADATFSGMRLPRADYGIFVEGRGATFSAGVYITNLTMTALVDAVTARTVHEVDIRGLTVFRSVSAVVLVGAGTANRFSVADATLQASGVGIRTSSDVQAVVAASNITFDRTNSTPAVGLAVAYAGDLVLRGVRVDGLPTGVDVLDARWVWVSDMDFVDNAWGLRLLTNPGSRTDINWTVDRDTRVSNSRLLIRGEVWVAGAALNVTRNGTIELFATFVSQSPTRFHFQGASSLLMNGSSRVVGREGLAAAGTVDARFTLELSALATVSLRDATLDRMGLAGPAPPEQKGIYVRARATTVTNVSFLNCTAALRSDGVDVTVVGSLFSGVDGQDLAVDVRGARLTIQSGTLFHEYVDGVRVTNGTGNISNARFNGVGAALTAISSSAQFVDSTVEESSEAVHASMSSNVAVCRLNLVSLGQSFVVESGSTVVTYCGSVSFNTPKDGEVRGGALVEYENVFIDRFDGSGRMTYIVETPGSTFRAYWVLNVFVSSCPTNYSLPIEGAIVLVRDRAGTIAFNGSTGAGGLVGPIRLLHYESTNNVETYHAPFTFSASRGALSTSSTHQANQTSNIELCLDDQPPEINLLLPTSPDPPPTRNSTIDIRGRAWDNVSGLASGYPCIIAARDSSACVPVPSSFDTQRPLREGLNTFVIVARDTFGNERNVTITVVRDTTAPEFSMCEPPFAYKSAVGELDLVCRLIGNPVNPPTISGVVSTGAAVDAAGWLRARITLSPGPNTFRVIVEDALENRNETSFSWTFDTTAPAPTLVSGYNRTVTRLFGVFLVGTVPTDTALVEWGGEPAPFPGFGVNVEWTNLTEGRNERVLRITDDVGNVWLATLWIEVDTKHNCTLFAPEDGEIVTRDTVAVGGSCDLDVVIQVTGVEGTVRPQEDGRWSTQVRLTPGSNLIEVRGVDSNDLVWNESVRVTYDPTTGSDGLPFAFIVLLILAAGVFVVAIVVLRRPRPPPPPEAPRPLTGAQKAPPRPKPPTMRLPEIPEDQRYRAPPPPPPPFPPPPPLPPPPPRR